MQPKLTTQPDSGSGGKQARAAKLDSLQCRGTFEA
jgi:hypothetical protein